ncbi:MAG: acyl-CoA dehydrogenase family protein [Cellvibrio sp.]|uniref:acyl-CoA dehydrogenase family protein n=1 Tax=Cellvibrio sp. TaxID=1965322 RepID=UPI002716CDFA|nr:acyl-CoA dehydrogenase family protein [Cellvibrio sp.]
MINTSVDLIQLDVHNWLEGNWPEYQQWVEGNEIPEEAVLQSFLAEFARPSDLGQLLHYLRALGRTPLLHLNRVIATACCAIYSSATELTHHQSNHSALMITAIDLGFTEYLFAELLAEVRRRQTFGVPLVRNQHVEFILAELQARLFALAALWELTAENPDLPGDLELFQSLSGPLLRELADQYLQFSGGRGYLKGHAAELAFRQVVLG